MLQQSLTHFNINFFSKRVITRQRRVTMHYEDVLCIEPSLSKTAISTPES